ncbi:MAG TPA: 16S rRNA (cytosine(1402)-N(4))-methyltransferase RsmH [Candidatus Paceibacterota bacterium]|nr:16S rRNA (cytosine(1402)-N(4))-methyltransferase RsmH [Candidatus Paceibacterota bacterium]
MHESVLLQETIDGLDLKAGDLVVDGTLGRAGHSIEAARREPTIRIIGIDRDEDALRESQARLVRAGVKFELFRGNFRDMDKFVSKADKVVLDLGVSSPHLDSSRRGFSFRNDEPLLMTMEKHPGKEAFTARDVVNGWAEEDIANVIYAYGEERYARRIARAIVEQRSQRPLESTRDLVEAIESAVPGIYKRGKIHPATRTFQALRITVNDELGSLRQGLERAFEILNPGGRLAVISFHSLEDRIVKIAMKEWAKQGKGDQFTKRPITPSDEEMARNPRSRSAKLRIFIKKGETKD